MSDYFTYYTESTIICLIIFCMMLFRDLMKVDKQEKQLKYDQALVSFMLYFLSDLFWAAVISGVLPKNRCTVVGANFLNCVFMAGIVYMWLRYVLAAENAPQRDQAVFKLILFSPYLASTVVLLALFLFAPHVLMDADLNILPPYYIFLILVPIIYIIATFIYTMMRAKRTEDPIEKRQHHSNGFFPLAVVAGGLLQTVVLPNTPIFCFCCALLMLRFYLQSMETQISVDPLTKLNNRGQLLRYVSYQSNLRIPDRMTFVVMFDVNDFKSINDTYGHAEGDRALIILADSLRRSVQNRNMPLFLGRYGGDEFILVAHPVEKDEIDQLISDIRAQIEMQCQAQKTPYILSVGVGYEELKDDRDTFQKCMQRADENMYRDKRRRTAG